MHSVIPAGMACLLKSCGNVITTMRATSSLNICTQALQLMNLAHELQIHPATLARRSDTLIAPATCRNSESQPATRHRYHYLRLAVPCHPAHLRAKSLLFASLHAFIKILHGPKNKFTYIRNTMNFSLKQFQALPLAWHPTYAQFTLMRWPTRPQSRCQGWPSPAACILRHHTCSVFILFESRR